jgi:ATP-binding cassette, subfamily B (MDR/TAP), member 1
MLNGLLGPAFGVLIIKSLFAMIIYMYDPVMLRKEVNKFILMMFIGGLLSFIFNLLAKWMFGVVGENITLNVRKQLYKSILLKHVGWHDN